MKTRFLLNLLFAFFITTGLVAQNNQQTVKEKSDKDESYVLIDVSYINDAVFMGRRDSIAAPYIFPSIGYFDKSGFFVDASASYLVGSEENRVDLFLGSLGYMSHTENLNGGISGTAYFFNEASYNVKSSVVADISGFLSYDFKVLEFSLLASTYFNDGSSADIFTGLTLNRVFFSNDQQFLINPTIAVYAGSQHFYQEYYSTSRLGNRKSKGKGQSINDSPTEVSTLVEIQDVSQFNILNVELSLPLQYYYKQFIFSLTPVLAIPQNSATITTEDMVITEDLESTFYFSAGISYWFNTKTTK
ncbi:hypothetical protein SAMN04488008_101236 [Maribacter orientalis]|uniref:Outer membrane protein beta-barrel domain-containing protein n=1 Tax=Maribacter orientalis TaxID=228957 RepID=A0A1H7FXI4_9FLAO|nr:hypothetical protein [Maribacter orientalis]SEK30504.1 hypothetical protein SAMN04488008_101236 [Maribacter orientalis]